MTYCGAPKTIKYEEVKLIIRAFETTPSKPHEIGNAKIFDAFHEKRKNIKM